MYWEGLQISTLAEGKCRIVAGENGDMQATFAEKVSLFLLWFPSEDN